MTDKTSYRANDRDPSDNERPSQYRYWNTRQPSTSNPYMRIGRNPLGRNPTPLQTSVFSRPPSRTGPETGTSGSASFHSIEQGPEPETELVDEASFRPEPEPNTETQLPIEEPVITIAPTTETATTMDVDHEGKSYLKKPDPFDGNRRKVDDFIHACNLFFEGSPDKDFPTNKQKIIFILSYMNTGEALHWRKNYIEMTVRQNDGTYQWPTKEVFLKQHFSMKTRKKNLLGDSTTFIKGTRQLKNTSMNSDLQSAKRDYRPTTT